MTLQEASRELWERYVQPPAGDSNVAAVGIGKDELVLYLKRRKKGYPAAYGGFTVRTEVTGGMTTYDPRQ